MTYIGNIHADMPQATSPLMFCDQFLSLAEAADRAGLRTAAEQLVYLAVQVLDDADTKDA